MEATYVLSIGCPHCGRITDISGWPHTERQPFAFTCPSKRGGCGGHAYVEPPDVTGFPNMEMVIVTPRPMTTAQYHYATGQATP